jgi:N-acetylglutamate synthase-like GNAT family acetyltransferase
VAKTRIQKSRVDARFDEKSFYLEEFRGRTLCFAISLSDCERPGGFAALGKVLRDMLANETRLIVLIGGGGRTATGASAVAEAQRRLRPFVLSRHTSHLFPNQKGRRSLAAAFVDLRIGRDVVHPSEASVGVVWNVLRRQPLFVGFVESDRLLDVAQRLSVQLKLLKLVVVEPGGGVSLARGVRLSFMDGSLLDATLHRGEAEWAGVASRRRTLEAIRAALLGGVGAVNICTLDGLAGELFTYEGSGTLFTLEDYCRVSRLGIDDFQAVERLILWGQREGYLKQRTPEEITQILASGYGATIGTNHLAGICALITEPYVENRAGEIVGLSTLTRFQGEGVGRKLVERAMQDAGEMGLRYVFACTTEPGAQAFFQRQGFRHVSAGQVPPSKWAGYDTKRLARVKAFRREVDAPVQDSTRAG